MGDALMLATGRKKAGRILKVILYGSYARGGWVDERLDRERAITATLRTPVNIIVHTLQEVNDGLAHGRYFFIDVAKDGIALWSRVRGY
jgi:hypothetical protein